MASEIDELYDYLSLDILSLREVGRVYISDKKRGVLLFSMLGLLLKLSIYQISTHRIDHQLHLALFVSFLLGDEH